MKKLIISLAFVLSACASHKTYVETEPIVAPYGVIEYCMRHPTATECSR